MMRDAVDERRTEQPISHELEVAGTLNAHDREGLEVELRQLARRHGLQLRIARAPMPQ